MGLPFMPPKANAFDQLPSVRMLHLTLPLTKWHLSVMNEVSTCFNWLLTFRLGRIYLWVANFENPSNFRICIGIVV